MAGWKIGNLVAAEEFAQFDRMYDGALSRLRDKLIRTLTRTAQRPERQTLIMQRLTSASEPKGDGFYEYKCVHGLIYLQFYLQAEDRRATILGFTPGDGPPN